MKCAKSTVRLATLLLLCTALDAVPAAKILLIGKDRDHPYQTHEYMADSKLLAKCLDQTPNIETTVSNGWPKDPAGLQNVDAIVLHVAMGGDYLFHPSRREKVQAMMKKGVGLTAIHWSTGAATGQVGELQLKTLGGWFNTYFSQYFMRKSTVKRISAEHPMSRGWTDYDLTEEFYIKLKFLDDIQPIAAAEVNGETYTIAWAYERPNADHGRSFGFVGGHFHKNFGLLEFRRMILNAILWTAHVDPPADGAPCDISEKDMELPPDTRTK